MRKNFLISFFILSLFIIGLISTLSLNPERTQSFFMESLNLKAFLSEKVKNFVSRKINDEDIDVNIETINFLKPDWPNILKIELNNVDIHSLKQKRKSKIKLIELGFSYNMLFKNLFLNDNEIQFSYINFQNLTLNARIDKDKFLPGPLFKIFSLINQNNLQAQSSMKKILQSKIVIGKIKFFLTYNRNLLREEILEINCENVFISKILNNSRDLYMDCNKGKNNTFSLKANLDEDFNNFSGKIKNINSNWIKNYWLDKNLKFLKTSFHSKLNGSYSIKTKKDYTIQSIKFISDESILFSKNIKEEKNLKTKVSGVFSWEKKNNIFEFTDVLVGDQLIVFGEIDLISKKGFSNFSIQKILVEDTKKYLIEFFNSHSFAIKSNFNKVSNKLSGGKLKNLIIKVKFSLLKKFTIEEIVGLSDFSNIRFQHKNKIFKKILSTISGDLDFRLKPQKFGDSIFNINLSASNGYILGNKNDIKYNFSKAKIIGKFLNNNLIISQADFYKNDFELEYTFHDVRINRNSINIAEAKYVKEKKTQYIFTDTNINNMNVTKSSLKIKNSPELSNFIKSKFDVELIGNIDFDIFLSGNIKNLNFDLKLKSNLENSHLKIHYLDLIKKKNITSSIESDISIIEGKFVFFKNTHLRIESNIYKIGFVEFKRKSTNKIIIKNLETPDTNVDEIILSNNDKNLIIQASGKKIDLSMLNKNLKNKTNINKKIILDLTADKIKLNSKISLTGNLKGEIKDSLFQSIAYGKISLGKASLLDNGKFEIYLDRKISRLKGLGLVGGAETKIVLQKKINSHPSLIFDTSDGGKLLNVLGFTKNIKSGDMKIDINFLNDEYNHYEGQIKSKKFSIINAPGIINSLSVLSFSGIGSIITGEGVFFDKGVVNIKVKNKNFNFDKLYLSSESLGIAARGNLNLQKKSINMRGSVAPIKLISKILSVVPAVGELLTGLKKEGLFAGQFEMQGLIDNPKIKLNTMSFAPGILRDIFSEDWLGNNNFFINRAID